MGICPCVILASLPMVDVKVWVLIVQTASQENVERCSTLLQIKGQ
jgi:hypothetical protein